MPGKYPGEYLYTEVKTMNLIVRIKATSGLVQTIKGTNL